jgi:hypothetical protein
VNTPYPQTPPSIRRLVRLLAFELLRLAPALMPRLTRAACTIELLEELMATVTPEQLAQILAQLGPDQVEMLAHLSQVVGMPVNPPRREAASACRPNPSTRTAQE